MKKLFLSLAMLVALVTFSNSTYCQENVPEPYIISVTPDSLFVKYDYTQTIFITVSVPAKAVNDPTEAAIEALKKRIIATCKLNKFDGFILNQIVFAKPFEEGKLIGYGTMIRKKTTPLKK